MKVHEIFYSLQGEGRLIGVTSVFLRLSGCNLNCEFCDTKYYTEGMKTDIKDIARRIAKYSKASDLVVTGGEPLLQQKGLEKLLPLVPTDRITIETNGTITPSAELVREVDLFSISPKLSNSGNPYEKRFNAEAIYRLLDTDKAYFKFVISNPKDIEEVIEMQDKFKIHNSDIYLMPKAQTRIGLWFKERWLAQECLDKGYNFTTRMHIKLWGKKKGV